MGSGTFEVAIGACEDAQEDLQGTRGDDWKAQIRKELPAVRSIRAHSFQVLCYHYRRWRLHHNQIVEVQAEYEGQSET